MELGWIGPESLAVCRSLLLPAAAEALERREPLTALAVTEDGLALGALAGHLEDGSCVIDSLYVSPEHRRRGVGRRLVEGLEGLLAEGSEAAELRLSYTVTLPEHEAMAPFLAALGFAPEEDEGENIYFATLEQAADGPLFRRTGGGSKEILPFARVDGALLTRADRTAWQQGAPMARGLLTDARTDKEVSCALVRAGRVEAFVAFDHSCCQRLTLACAWSGGGGPAALAGLLQEAFRQAREKYPPETPLAIQAVSPASAALVRALLPQAVPVSFTYAKPLDG